MSEKNIDAFCITKDEKTIYAVNKLGEILTIEVDNFNVLNRTQIHSGSVNVIAIHDSQQYLATLGNDGYLAICKITDDNIECLHFIKIRHLKPEFDHYRPGPSTSQALAFHPSQFRLASRAGTGGIFELTFTEKDYKILHCHRLHERYDPFTLHYTGNQDELLSGSNAMGGIVLSSKGKIIYKWHNDKAIHWFEPIEPGVYLVASDAMRVLRFELDTRKTPLRGPKISIDHLEHVNYNKTSQKAYTSAFDRRVLEIDPKSCEIIREVWKAPFKLRWIYSLNRQPEIMIVQCRNGGLYKINSDQGEVISVLKETPDAQWSIESFNHQWFVAGEGHYYKTYTAYAKDKKWDITRYRVQQHSLTEDQYSYNKRICSSEQFIAFGRANGELIVKTKTNEEYRFSFNSAIRDLCFGENHKLYVCCEEGGLYEIDLIQQEKKRLFKLDGPIWSLAVNEKYLAFADRRDSLYLYELETGQSRFWLENMGFAKRMKWVNESCLYFSGGSSLLKAQIGSDSKIILANFHNTVEDFVWDAKRRYLVILSYTRFLYLCDYETGAILQEHADRVDYSKGLQFIPPENRLTNYETDFITVGRSGVPEYHRIHDDRIISYGFII